MADWIIESFSAAQAFGTLRDRETGDEARFSLESWWPCDPDTARQLQDSDQRRDQLMPQPGERVDVTWKQTPRGATLASRVARLDPVDGALPACAFLPWFAQLAAHIPQLADWPDTLWDDVTRASTEDIAPAIRSPAAADPAVHLGLLVWLRDHLPSLVGARLSWLTDDATPSTSEAETFGGTVHLALPRPLVVHLAAARLVHVLR